MKRLTFDVVLASTLALAPLAVAQDFRSDGTSHTPGDITRDREGVGRPSTHPETDIPPMAPPMTRSSPVTTPDTTPRVPAAATDSGDMAIVRSIHEANQKEIAMAQMALDKAESAKVKAYARKLVADHQAADKQLMAYADRKDMDRSKLQQTATAAGGTGASGHSGVSGHSEDHARLNDLSGQEFDRAFAAMMLADHDEAITTVRAARDGAIDPALRNLLNAMLPKLEQHRRNAQQLVDKTKG